jgi:NAD(P)-dependent dehydrogenase (short-subunit alcohol dehydrogenase family)
MTVNGCAGYTSAKAGVMGFSRHLAFEVGPYKITFNTICPGMVIEGDHKPPPEVLEKMKAGSLLGDITTAEDTANAVLFLASENARMITGTNLGAYAVAPGGKEHWDNFVKRRKDWKAQRKQSKQ